LEYAEVGILYTKFGEFRDGQGFYNWVFLDGEDGKTIITLDSHGFLHGKVRGAGLNWNYCAIKTDGRVLI